MRRTLWIAVVLACVAALAWWVARPRRMHAPTVIPEASPAVVDLEQSALTPLQSAPSRPVRADASTTGPAAPPGALDARAAFTLHGTIVVVDERGVEHPGESGTLALGLWRGQRADPVETSVVEGRWTLTTDPCNSISVDSALLGGHMAYALAGQDRWPVSPDGRLDLHVVYPPVLVLNARDARTNEHVRRLEVVPTVGNAFDAPLVPPFRNGKWKIEIQGDSPLAIRPEEIADSPVARILYVKAPGYAWSHTSFDRRVGGEVFVELRPGCGLDVRVIGADTSGKATLQLAERLRPWPLLEEPFKGRASIALEDLPPGAYTLYSRIGNWADHPTELGRVDVDLTPERRASVELVLTAPPPLERAQLSGVIVLPAAWQVATPKLAARFLDPALDDRPNPAGFEYEVVETTAESTTHAWRMHPSQVGRYELNLKEPLYATVVELHPGGTSGVRIDVPAPATVSVRVVDAVSQSEVSIGAIQWRPHVEGGARGGRTSTVTRAASGGTFDFRCPIGMIEVVSNGAIGQGYASPTLVSTIGPGHNDVVLALTKACGVTVRVRAGDQALDASAFGGVSVTAVDGDGRMTSGRMTDKLSTVMLSKPGRYRVALHQPVPGFTYEPVIVDLAPDQIADVELILVRKP